MVVSLYFGEKSHVSKGQNVSFKEPFIVATIGSCQLAKGVAAPVGRGVGRGLPRGRAASLGVVHLVEAARAAQELHVEPVRAAQALLVLAACGRGPPGGKTRPWKSWKWRLQI